MGAFVEGLGQSTYAQFGKRVLDISLIVLTAPIWMLVIGICAIALMMEGGNPFYRQSRLGRGGRTFQILKLRTMVMDADAQFERLMQTDPELRHEWETTQKLKNDPRITRVGGFLRKTSLDELPQLWNVFIGDMSLVGPRPMLPEQLPLYGPSGSYFSLRPGITGLWQVSARNEEVFSFRSRVDATYARSVSFWQDVVLLFKTIGVVARRTGY
nr:sugar transferase [Falsiruegeria litorea]